MDDAPEMSPAPEEMMADMQELLSRLEEAPVEDRAQLLAPMIDVMLNQSAPPLAEMDGLSGATPGQETEALLAMPVKRDAAGIETPAELPDGSLAPTEMTEMVIKLARMILPHLPADHPAARWTVAFLTGQGVAPGKPTRGRPPALRPLGQDGYLRTRSDRICKAVVEALTPQAIRPLDPAVWEAHGVLNSEEWWQAYPFQAGSSKDRVKGLIGFSRKPAEAIWDALQKNGALAVKAQYVLFARAYEETDAEPGVFVTISITQFCDDLGYKRKKGAHRPERKREAMKVLEMLTTLELCANYITPQDVARRLRGPIWLRGHIAEQMDGYADLFGVNRVGEPAQWEPVAFSYAPGRFFADSEWRKYNRRVAKVGAGLLELRTDTDQWAIMVGGYLGTLSRMNGYRTSVLKVQTLLERTGLARAEKRNPGRAIDKLEAALDKVAEVRIISSWDYTNTNPCEPDMDDADDLEKLIHAADKRELRNIVIGWPEELPEIQRGEKPKALPKRKRC